MKKLCLNALLTCATLTSVFGHAANYEIDSKGAHASINFTVSYLGFTLTSGQFNKFSGVFIYDPKKLEESQVTLYVDISSVDKDHSERDKHILSDELLDTKKNTTANFVSTKITPKCEKGTFTMTGNFTLNGVTKSIDIDAQTIGADPDPWGGERAGFSGTTRIELDDFNIPIMGSSSYVDLTLYMGGIKMT